MDPEYAPGLEEGEEEEARPPKTGVKKPHFTPPELAWLDVEFARLGGVLGDTPALLLRFNAAFPAAQPPLEKARLATKWHLLRQREVAAFVAQRSGGAPLSEAAAVALAAEFRAAHAWAAGSPVLVSAAAFQARAEGQKPPKRAPKSRTSLPADPAAREAAETLAAPAAWAQAAGLTAAALLVDSEAPEGAPALPPGSAHKRAFVAGPAAGHAAVKRVRAAAAAGAAEEGGAGSLLAEDGVSMAPFPAIPYPPVTPAMTGATPTWLITWAEHADRTAFRFLTYLGYALAPRGSVQAPELRDGTAVADIVDRKHGSAAGAPAACFAQVKSTWASAIAPKKGGAGRSLAEVDAPARLFWNAQAAPEEQLAPGQPLPPALDVLWFAPFYEEACFKPEATPTPVARFVLHADGYVTPHARCHAAAALMERRLAALKAQRRTERAGEGEVAAFLRDSGLERLWDAGAVGGKEGRLCDAFGPGSKRGLPDFCAFFSHPAGLEDALSDYGIAKLDCRAVQAALSKRAAAEP